MRHIVKMLAILAALALTIGLTSCGSDDDGGSPSASISVTTKSQVTTGSTESAVVSTNGQGLFTAKVFTSGNSTYYEFTETSSYASANVIARAADDETEKRGGTWIFYENGIQKYSGTYTGDISLIKSSTGRRSLTLTVIKVYNTLTDKITTVSESKSFSFNIMETTFSATIPAISLSIPAETPLPIIVDVPKSGVIVCSSADANTALQTALSTGSFNSLSSAKAGETLVILVLTSKNTDAPYKIDCAVTQISTGSAVSLTGPDSLDNASFSLVYYGFTMPASAVTVSVTYKETVNNSGNEQTQ
ncbi:MAG: hypothetical protein IJP62_01670 [Treponema sp.]|nr:hypothetical protein [Treponema sp.]